jgi:hypothetical protein
MDARLISDILQCRITSWNHKNISALNPGIRWADLHSLRKLALQMLLQRHLQTDAQGGHLREMPLSKQPFLRSCPTMAASLCHKALICHMR